MAALKVTEMAYLLHQIGYEAEESAKALQTVYLDTIPLQIGTTLKTNWTTPPINARQMAQILAKIYGIVSPIESYVEDLKAQELTATETAKKLKQDIPRITLDKDKLAELLSSKRYNSADTQAIIQAIFPE